MSSKDMAVENLREKIFLYEGADSVEIEKIICTSDFEHFSLVEQEEYEVTPSNSLHNYFLGIKVTSLEKTDKSADPYKIVTEELYQICNKCNNKKFFDEKYDTYYCPACDSTVNRLKDKLFNWRD